MLWVFVNSLLTLGQPHPTPPPTPEKAHSPSAKSDTPSLPLRWKESTYFSFELNFCFILEHSCLTMLS